MILIFSEVHIISWSPSPLHTTTTSDPITRTENKQSIMKSPVSLVPWNNQTHNSRIIIHPRTLIEILHNQVKLSILICVRDFTSIFSNILYVVFVKLEEAENRNLLIEWKSSLRFGVEVVILIEFCFSLGSPAARAWWEWTCQDDFLEMSTDHSP